VTNNDERDSYKEMKCYTFRTVGSLPSLDKVTIDIIAYHKGKNTNFQ